MTVEQLRKRKRLLIVGIMSGTSIDGIDFVLTDVKKEKNQIQPCLVKKAYAPFSAEIKERIKKAATDQLTTYELGRLHHDLGRLYADQLKKIAQKQKWKFDLIGLHGQTVFHEAPRATLQIGEPSYLSETFEVPVVADFRVADLALKGQGAPLASLFHQTSFKALLKKGALSVQNLGGIGNCTLIDSKGKVLGAFDTGPANMLVDSWISQQTDGKTQFDKDGKLSSQGIPVQKIVDKVLKESFFKQKPPKSFGREQFGNEYLKMIMDQMKGNSLQDQLATLVELSARSVAQAYKDFGPKNLKTVVLCGGGAYNSNLIKRIQFHLPNADVLTSQDLDWPPEAIEGAAFALLAAFKVWNLPSNIPSTTGAKKSVSLGKIIEVF